MVEPGEGVAQTALGPFVTVHFRDAPAAGAGFALVREQGGSLYLEPLGPRSTMPFVGERVHCRSATGQWTTTALSTTGGILELAAPRWLSRSSMRRGRRVVVEAPVEVRVGDETSWAGRLRDVSMKGAAVLVERAADLKPGDTVAIRLGGGAIQATVRSVRHFERLLVVVGLSFDRLEAPALRWVAAAVAGRAPGSMAGEPPPG